MLNYVPESIVIDSGVAETVLAEEICLRFPDVPRRIVEGFSWRDDERLKDPGRHPLTQGKRTLHLKQFQGAALKSCPGWSKEVVCCGYYTLDLLENCPFECTYCILQAFLNKPVITVHANLEEILEEVRQKVTAHPLNLFRIGTGEHSDSLALDPVLQINPHLVRFFAKLPNAVLELKTKSDHVDHLLDLPHGGRTIISWSLNPETIILQEEHKTARLDERLNAARKASDAGYKLGFHFDPLINHPGWEKGYQELIEQLLDTIPPKRIAWISLGALRYLPRLKTIVEERFPASRVFLGEFIPGEDGKMRYLKKIRKRMLGVVQQHIQHLAPEVSTYLCMEKAQLWKGTMPVLPQNTVELEEILGNKLRQQQTMVARNAA